jgi:hypothetical protein
MLLFNDFHCEPLGWIGLQADEQYLPMLPTTKMAFEVKVVECNFLPCRS